MDPGPDDAGLVVASHGRGEKEALEAALRAGVPYVALVGSRIRAASVLAALDVPDADRARVRSPAGLDIGARSAGEIALSILAELVAERARPRVPLPRPPSADLEERAGDTPGDAGPYLKIGAAGPATAVDPVCGMTVVVTPGALRAEAGGRLAYFCAEGCRRAFLAEPERYA